MRKLQLLILFVMFMMVARAQDGPQRRIQGSLWFVFSDELWQGDLPGVSLKPISLGFGVQQDLQVRISQSNFFVLSGLAYYSHNLSSDALLRRDAAGLSYFLPIDSLEPAGETAYKHNRLNFGYLDIPLGITYRHPGGFEAGLGLRGGIRLTGSTFFDGDDYIHHGLNDVNVTYERLPNLADWRFGLTAMVGYKAIRLQAFYSLTQAFKKDKGPEISPLSLGLAFSLDRMGSRNPADMPQVEELPPPPPPPPMEEVVEELPVEADTISKLMGEEAPVFTVVEVMPSYPGGEDARQRFILENLNYPLLAKENGIQGTVYLSFVVEPDGKLTGARALRGIGGGCDEEALRVINLMPNWIPGTQSGKAVRVQFIMPLRFILKEGIEISEPSGEAYEANDETNEPLYGRSRVPKSTMGFSLNNNFWQEDDPVLKPKTVNLAMDFYFLRNFRLGGKGFAFSTGLEIAWQLMRNNAILMDTGSPAYFRPVTDFGDYSYQKSKITWTYIDVPLELSYRHRSGFYISAGAKAGYCTQILTYYKGDDYIGEQSGTIKLYYRNPENMQRFRYGLTAGLGYKALGIKAYYGLSGIFREDKGPEIIPWSVGLTLRFDK